MSAFVHPLKRRRTVTKIGPDRMWIVVPFTLSRTLPAPQVNAITASARNRISALTSRPCCLQNSGGSYPLSALSMSGDVRYELQELLEWQGR